MRVLVALDGTELSVAALRAIGPWARIGGAEVVLLTIRHPHKIHETVRWQHASAAPAATGTGRLLGGLSDYGATAGEDRGQAFERMRDEAEEPLHAEAAKHLAGVKTEYAVEIAENVPETIAHYAETHDIDLIAIGTHGRKGIAHILHGSVAEALLRVSVVPVMMVREGMRMPLGF